MKRLRRCLLQPHPPLSPVALMPHLLALSHVQRLQRSRKPSLTGLGALTLAKQMIGEDVDKEGISKWWNGSWLVLFTSYSLI